MNSRLPARVRHRSSVALISMAIAVAAMANRDNSKQDLYTTRLPDGGQVHVRFVGPAESSKLPTWAPDGGPTEDGPSKIGSAYTMEGNDPGIKHLQVCFDISGVPSNNEDSLSFPTILTPAKLGGRENHGGSRGGAFNGNLTDCYGFSVPKSWKTADLEVGLGYGAFKRAASFENGTGDFDVKLIPKHQKQTSTMKSSTGEIKEEYRLQDSVEIEFELPVGLEHKQWCLKAFDKKGNSIKPWITHGGWDIPGESGGERKWFAVCQCDAHDIQRVEIHARNYKWIRVKQIHLQPNNPPSN